MADIEETAEKFGFGCFSAGFGLAFGLAIILLCGYWINGCIVDRSNLAEKETEAVVARQKEDKLKDFALAEAPTLWQTVLKLRAVINVQEQKEKRLRSTLIEFGRVPEQDGDYTLLVSIKEDMTNSLGKILQRIEDAYLSACKFQATPSKEEYNGKMRQTLNDGLLEAEAVEKKYDELRTIKRTKKD